MDLYIDSDRLQAFAVAASGETFARSARAIGITQSALSQRIAKLEVDLGVTLFMRERRGLRLTAEGETLRRYCRTHDGLEREMLQGLMRSTGTVKGFAGVLRIAGFSSVMQSVVLPALTPMVQASPRLVVHAATREVRDLPDLLRSGEADFILVDRKLDSPGLRTERLGEEHYVLVESTRSPVQADRLLDHDPEDTTTAQFFRLNRKHFASEQRSFLDDIYGLRAGALAGWGRAVLPKHLVRGVTGLRVVPGYRVLVLPVILHYWEQPFYTAVHRETIRILVSQCPARLRAG